MPTNQCDCKTTIVNGEEIHELTCSLFDGVPMGRKVIATTLSPMNRELCDGQVYWKTIASEKDTPIWISLFWLHNAGVVGVNEVHIGSVKREQGFGTEWYKVTLNPVLARYAGHHEFRSMAEAKHFVEQFGKDNLEAIKEESTYYAH